MTKESKQKLLKRLGELFVSAITALIAALTTTSCFNF